MNAGHNTLTRGRIARMTSRALVVAALVGAASLTFTAPADAVQPPARCKVLSTTQHLETAGTPGEKMATVVVTTTTSRCRGKIVVTRTAARWLPGPR
jgi:hypothetical protein